MSRHYNLRRQELFKSTTLTSRSAIEAHRTRLASWKRSMPPLSPLTHEVRGAPVKAHQHRERQGGQLKTTCEKWFG